MCSPSPYVRNVSQHVYQNAVPQVGDTSLLSAATKIDKNQILTLPCDILVPAAIGGVITEQTADSIDAKYVIEAANGPTTPEGDARLRERGITVLPDIYTNGGLTPPTSVSSSLQTLTSKNRWRFIWILIVFHDQVLPCLCTQMTLASN